MSTSTLLLLNVILVTRLGFLMRETPASARFYIAMCALQIAALGLFQFAWQLPLLAVALVAGNGLGYVLEKRGAALPGTRALTFLVLAGSLLLLSNSLTMAPWVLDLIIVLGADADPALIWHPANVVTCGVLLLTNEINLLIRYGFQRLNLEPKLEPAGGADASATQPATDIRQYNAGRVIGVLERYFILALLLAGSDLSAVAVILAAKGFARFKQMDRREFAEYVLIGTLASTLAAVLVALAVKAALVQSRL